MGRRRRPVVLSQGAHARMGVPVGEGFPQPRSGRSRDVSTVAAAARSLSPAVAVVGTRPDGALACRPRRARPTADVMTSASSWRCKRATAIGEASRVLPERACDGPDSGPMDAALMAEEYSWRRKSRSLAAESSRPLSFSVRRAAIEPTIATSRPSRIQTVPSPMTTIQWKRDQGSRSSRAGTRVSMAQLHLRAQCAGCGTRRRRRAVRRSGRPAEARLAA